MKWVVSKWVSASRGSGSGRKRSNTKKCGGEKWGHGGGVFDLVCAFFIVNWGF